MPKADLRKKIGQIGENLACKWLQKKGYKLIMQDYHIQGGQIDIVMQTPSSGIVFVEVKTRIGNKQEEHISQKQMLTIQRTAKHYLYTHNQQHQCYQFDVVWIYIYKKTNATIRHHRNVLER